MDERLGEKAEFDEAKSRRISELLDGEFDVHQDLNGYSADELQEALRQSRAQYRSVCAEMVGRSHAFEALQSRLETAENQAKREQKEAWFSEVAQLAHARNKRRPSGPKRFSLLVDLNHRLREAYGELGDLSQEVETLRIALQNRQKSAPSGGLLGRFRRKERAPDPDSEEFEDLHRLLDEQEDQIVHLEREVQRKSDAVGDMLQKFESVEDARREAVTRYKGLLKQQERLAKAFQEQSQRSTTLKEENATLNQRVEALKAAQSAGFDLDKLAEIEDELQAMKGALTRARARAERAEEEKYLAEEARTATLKVVEGAKAQLGDLKSSLQAKASEIQGLEAAIHQLKGERDLLADKIETLESFEIASPEGAQIDNADGLRLENADLRRKLALVELNQETLSGQWQKGQEQLKEAQQALDYLRDRLAQGESLSKGAQDKVADLKAENQRLKSALEAAEAAQKKDGATREHLLKQVQNAHQEAIRLNQALEGQEHTLLSQKTALEYAEKALVEAQNQEKAAQSALSDAKNRYIQLEGEWERALGVEKALRDENESLLKTLKISRNHRIEAEEAQDKLQKEVQALLDSVAALKGERDRLGHQIQGLEAENQSLKNAQSQLQSDLDETKTALETSQGLVMGLQRQVDGHLSEKSSLERSLQESEARTKRLEETRRTLSDKLEEKSERITGLNTRLAGVREGMRQTEERLEKTQKALDESQGEAAKYLEESENYRHRLTENEAELDATRIKNKALQESLEESIEAKAQWMRAQARVEALQAQQGELDAKLAKEVEKNLILRQDQERLTSDGEKQSKRILELEDLADENRQNSLRFRQDLRESRQAISELTQERDEARAQHEKTTASLLRLERSQAQWIEDRDAMEKALAEAKAKAKASQDGSNSEMPSENLPSVDIEGVRAGALKEGHASGYAEGLKAGRERAFEEAREIYVADIREAAFEEGRLAALQSANLKGNIQELDQASAAPSPAKMAAQSIAVSTGLPSAGAALPPDGVPTFARGGKNQGGDLPPDGVPTFARSARGSGPSELPPDGIPRFGQPKSHPPQNQALSKARAETPRAARTSPKLGPAQVSEADETWHKRIAGRRFRQDQGEIPALAGQRAARDDDAQPADEKDERAWSDWASRRNHRPRATDFAGERGEAGADAGANPPENRPRSSNPPPEEDQTMQGQGISNQSADAQSAEAKSAERWHRPIVDINAPSGPVRLVADNEAEVPTEAEIEETLLAGNYARAQRLARSRWRQNPLDEAALTLFFKASKAKKHTWMEALVELDERMPPEKTALAQATVISGALIKVEQMAEAVPYLLWSLAQGEDAHQDARLDRTVEALNRLREKNVAALRAGPLLKTLQAMPLGTLAPLLFKLQGFELREPAQAGRVGDFFVYLNGKNRFSGGSLKEGQGILIRTLGACGSRIENETYGQLVEMHEAQGSAKTRYTYLVIPQELETSSLKEIRRLRRWKRHYIGPMSRDEIVGALSYGTEDALLKSSLKK